MADIKFPCPQCGVSLKVKEELAGKKIKCPKCAAVAPIPATATVAPPVQAPRPAAPPPHAMPAAAPEPQQEEFQPPPRVADAPRRRDHGPIDRQRQQRNLEEDWQNADLGRPRRREAPPPKRGFDFIGWLSFLLFVGYLTALGLVMYGIVGPKVPTIKAKSQLERARSSLAARA
jgi:hypothetical protein